MFTFIFSVQHKHITLIFKIEWEREQHLYILNINKFEEAQFIYHLRNILINYISLHHDNIFRL